MAVIALDIGGTKIKGAIVSSKYNIVTSVKVPTESNKSKRYILNKIKTVITSLEKQSKYKITAVGVALAGTIDKKGRLTGLLNTIPPLNGIYIKKFFSRITNLPVIIENDANCFTLAESVLGRAKNKNTVLGVAWGTGIGAGLVMRDQNGATVYTGSTGSGFEIGHCKVYSKALGKYAELELVAGGKFLPSVYKAFGGTKNLLASEIIHRHDSASRKATTEAITQLGYAIGTIINIISPDMIVFGGGLSNSYELFEQRLKNKINRFALKEYASQIEFTRFSLSDDQGVLGAAHLALKNKNKK
ncbi:MAG: ROK family protein [Nanobdellota archaeon]